LKRSSLLLYPIKKPRESIRGVPVMQQWKSY
jgi:hypothetical protein